jgi:hypothetical protein
VRPGERGHRSVKVVFRPPAGISTYGEDGVVAGKAENH